MSHEPPWVLVRGLTRERAHWGRFPAQLAEALGGAPVITVDLPGAGTLHRQRCPLPLGDLVQACRAQVQAEGVRGPVRLLGLSLGGMVVAQWLMQWPTEVAAAAVVNTSSASLSPLHHRLRPAAWRALLAMPWLWHSRGAELTVLRLTSSAPDRHAAVLGAWVRVQQARPVSRLNALRQLWAAARYRLPPGLPACPVLVVNSAADGLVHPRCSQALAAHWGCRLETHAQAGHDLPLDDGPWLARTLAAWAAGLPG